MPAATCPACREPLADGRPAVLAVLPVGSSAVAPARPAAPLVFHGGCVLGGWLPVGGPMPLDEALRGRRGWGSGPGGGTPP